MSQKIGLAAEKHASSYLKKHGLQWIESNYRCRWGEIDLIMREGIYLVFVEVRARASLSFGGAAASVTYVKQKKLIKTASHYLLSKKVHDNQPTRFDVLVLEGAPPQIEWIKNAFGLDY